MKIKFFVMASLALAVLGSFVILKQPFLSAYSKNDSPLVALKDDVRVDRETVFPSADIDQHPQSSVSKSPVTLNNDGYFDSDGFPSQEDWEDIAEFHQYDTMWGGRERSGYKYYSESQLVELADGGDLQAMRELVHRYSELSALRNVADMKLSVEPEIGADGFPIVTEELSIELSEYYEKRRYYIDKAVVYGDRQMLDQLSAFNLVSGRLIMDASAEEKNDAALEMLAYYEFFGMRGMQDKKYEGMASFFYVYGDEIILPPQLTEQHVAEIRQRAQAIYDSYEQRRLDLGLGPFDNSVPKGKAQEFEWVRPAMIKMIKDETGYEITW